MRAGVTSPHQTSLSAQDQEKDTMLWPTPEGEQLSSFTVAERTTGSGGKITAGAVKVLTAAKVGMAAEMVFLAVAKAVAVAVKVGVSATITIMREVALTRQGLGQVVEHPENVCKVALRDPNGETVGAARRAVSMDAEVAIKGRLHHGTSSLFRSSGPTTTRSRWWREAG